MAFFKAKNGKSLSLCRFFPGIFTVLFEFEGELLHDKIISEFSYFSI